MIIVAAVMLLLAFLGLCKNLLIRTAEICIQKNDLFCTIVFTDVMVLVQCFQYWGCSLLYTCMHISYYLLVIYLRFLLLDLDIYNCRLCNFVCRLVIIGWILVAGTFILCGVFLLLHK